jgi:tellurite resistance protein TerA
MTMTELIAGANLSLNDALLQLHIVTASQQQLQPDFAAYLLAQHTGKVRGDDDMVFYGQTQNRNGSVKWSVQAKRNRFFLALNQLDSSVAKVAICLSLESPHTLNDIDHLQIELQAEAQRIATARIEGHGRSEAALIIGEFYRHQGRWKFRLVAQGFNGGLKPLSEFFGVDIQADVAAGQSQDNTAENRIVPRNINLSKITLDKLNSSINLKKQASGFGEIKINLNWNRQNHPVQPSGFFKKLRPQPSIDLDLGCLYEMQDGSKSVVQALGNCFGEFTGFPYIQLSADDRTGAISDGEWLRINGQHWSKIRRVIIFAFIYQGAPNWAQTDAQITLYVPDQAPIEIGLTEGQPFRMCGIAALSNHEGSILVQRHVQYLKGHRELDQAFDFGLRWQAGSK